MTVDHSSHPMNRCWSHIGVDGDRSCAELETVMHCRNCSVYATAGRGLLERDVPLDYLNEWTTTLAQPQKTAFRTVAATISVIIFRLSQEYFALPMPMLQEVTHPAPIHTMPHRRNHGLLGLVNIRGEILLCTSLTYLLGLAQAQADSELQRMIVVGHSNRTWVFLVDEVQGICRFQPSELKATPVVVSHATGTYTQGVIDWHKKKVNYLDAELLFHSLDRKLL